ncbi:MAG: DNA-3-methyladenine glycosylase family protein [Anaerovoracaceae bacterium]
MMRFETTVRDFCPDQIFDCGQCFRWSREPDGSWSGIAGGRVANVKLIADTSQNPCGGQNPHAGGSMCGGENPHAGTLVVSQEAGPAGETEESMEAFWREYLDLDRDYGEIKTALRQADPVMDRVIAAGEGIRILKQDLWETMVSFIISQNNNIPRIRGCIEALAKNYGQPAEAWDGKPAAGQDGRMRCSLPGPDILAALTRDDMDRCGMGYRGPYLIDTACQVLEAGGMDAVRKDLETAKAQGPEQLAEALRRFAGVGPKVAACIALFGMQELSAFPVDVWMRRILSDLYGMDEKNVREMERRGREDFAPWGGVAQQYLFFYARQNL